MLKMFVYHPRLRYSFDRLRGNRNQYFGLFRVSLIDELQGKSGGQNQT